MEKYYHRSASTLPIDSNAIKGEGAEEAWGFLNSIGFSSEEEFLEDDPELLLQAEWADMVETEEGKVIVWGNCPLYADGRFISWEVEEK